MLCMQVVKDIHKLKLDSNGEPMEATSTRDLKHPSIMKTMAHAWWVASDRGGLSGEQQCWMILEYCDRGSVVVSRAGLLPVCPVTTAPFIAVVVCLQVAAQACDRCSKICG